MLFRNRLLLQILYRQCIFSPIYRMYNSKEVPWRVNLKMRSRYPSQPLFHF